MTWTPGQSKGMAVIAAFLIGAIIAVVTVNNVSPGIVALKASNGGDAATSATRAMTFTPPPEASK